MQIHQNDNKSGQTNDPQSIEAEQQLLGALLIDNTSFDKVSDLIKKENFYDPVHAEIFEVITGLIAEDRTASPVSLSVSFSNYEPLKPLGGVSYLARLAAMSVSAFAIREYAEMVVDLFEKRQFLASLDTAKSEIIDGRHPVQKTALDMEATASALIVKSANKPLVQSHLSALIKTVENVNSAYQGVVPYGLSTGLPDLDDMLAKMRAGNMIVLAGRPAMGKTTTAQSIAFNVAKAGGGVFFGSLEMLAQDLGVRFASLGLKHAGVHIPYNRLIKGDLSETEMRQFVGEAKAQGSLPIIYGEPDVREVGRFRAAVRRAKASFEKSGVELKLIVVDYVQKMTVNGSKSIYDGASYASDMCKSVALDYEVPVLALAQLSRNVENRDPAIPTLSDLRETGKLEEDADVVIFCYRAAYYLDRKIQACENDYEARADLEAMAARLKDNLELIVAKQRSGPTGSSQARVDLGTCHVWQDPVQQGMF